MLSVSVIAEGSSFVEQHDNAKVPQTEQVKESNAILFAEISETMQKQSISCGGQLIQRALYEGAAQTIQEWACYPCLMASYQ